MIPKLHPFQGQVLIALFPADTMRNGLFLPDKRNEKDKIGRQPAARARVLDLGCWPQAKNKQLMAYEFKKGDVVLVDLAVGKDMSDGPDRYKLIDYSQVLAVLEATPDACPTV